MVFLNKLTLLSQLFAHILSSGWDYPDEGNNWSHAFPMCQDGATKKQSPINVKRREVTENTVSAELESDYWGKAGIKNLNNGHTLKISAPEKTSHSGDVEIKSWGITKYKTHEYESLQFHFHQPSEHTFDGYRYDMELHQVHQRKDGELWKPAYLVHAFFFMIGEESSFLKQTKYTKVGDKIEDFKLIDGELSPMDWIEQVNDDDYGMYHYEGSFTTPPCTEGVEWFLWRKPLMLSKDQWDAFSKIVPVPIDYKLGTGNYRRVQTSNTSRGVELYRWKLKNGMHKYTDPQIVGITLGSLAIQLITAAILGWFSYLCYKTKTEIVIHENPVEEENGINK